MHESLTSVNDWAVANKTKAMLITGKRLATKMKPKQLDLNYKQVSSSRLLGMEMDEELNFKEQVRWCL